MWKPSFKNIFLALGITTWFLLLYLVGQLSYFAFGPFSTSAYDVSRRLTASDNHKTALLVRDYHFNMNFRLFIFEDYDDPPPRGPKDALWSSDDYPTSYTSTNWHEDLEWSEDSSVIAVSIEGQYVFAYNFGTEEKLENNEDIRQLLELHNRP
jgi:hypothetical protein